MPQADWIPTEKQSLIVAYQTASPPSEVAPPDPPRLAEGEGIFGPEPIPGYSSPAPPPFDPGWPSLA